MSDSRDDDPIPLLPPAAAPAVWLLDVEPVYHGAFRALAGGRGLAVRIARGGPEPCAAEQAALAVVRVSWREREAAARAERVRRMLGGAPLVALADGLDAEAAVDLVRRGFRDVISHPAPAEHAARRALRHVPGSGAAADALVGESAPMRRLREEIESVAGSESTVLLTGETGTGKGLVARAIHRRSPRAAGPFVHVDCAALSATLIESELFGHERGAFTGAVERRAGRFELAARGTIFLDEIGDLEPRLQSKLLRVLQDREYERIGGSRTLPMTARVIAATSLDLHEAVRAGRFRADLYYRLRVLHLGLPPLRERREDLPLLVAAAGARLAAHAGAPPPVASEAFLDRLARHAWPGNVRELMNAIERALLRAGGGRLEAEHLDGGLELPRSEIAGAEAASRLAPIAAEPRAPTPPCVGRDAEEARRREAVAAALRAAGGNVARAARRLGMPRSTLRYWIQRHGLQGLVPKD